MAKKKPEPTATEKAAQRILQNQGTQDFAKWKQETVAKKKFAILQGEDVE